ncbi:hypothetical protein B0W48_14900 [Pseudoalteromonas aliena]|jgi:transposase|uniref:Transposase n=1 Tax=Pseudoalteromonas aliena TaxID=247523 RepID=A0A1Q2H0R4_9GAMM|nr:hypothetical protein B0W48_14900 [Pseudoalteromonas aliena]
MISIFTEKEHTMEEVLYRLSLGCPWRDLPACLGLYNTVYLRPLMGLERHINTAFQITGKE